MGRLMRDRRAPADTLIAGQPHLDAHLRAEGKDRVLKTVKSEDASIQDWVNRDGNDVRGAANVGDFIRKLEQC